MSDLPLLEFIPFRRTDILRMCIEEARLEAGPQEQFLRAAASIEKHFQHEFYVLKQQLKDAYAPLDPDADTRTAAGLEDGQDKGVGLVSTIEQIFTRANYVKITKQDLQRAFHSASLFHVRLYVDINDFEEVLLYYRGAEQREEEMRSWFGLRRKTARFINYERVVLYIRFKEDIDPDSTLGDCRPGSTMLKLFQNVPDADLEMLFPNTRIGMRALDKLMIGIPAVVSGAAVLSTKLSATLVLLGSLVGFWLGVNSEQVEIDRGALLVLLAGVGALVAYLWKQFSKFRNRKLKYTQALTENLYFKLLDNNAGVLYRILDEAEESECKESLLAYYFLLAQGEPMTAADLDSAIETWFAHRWECRLNFEIDDALVKLQQLGLASCAGKYWQLVF